MTDIRQLKYTNDGEIYTNLTYDDLSWNKIPVKYSLTNRVAQQTRDKPIPISAAKYEHLQEICQQSLSQDFHWFYKNLPHKWFVILILFDVWLFWILF